MINLKEIKDKNKWNNFIINSDFKFYSFLQSWEWGEFQNLAGKNTIRYGVFEGKKQIGAVQIIKVYAKRGNYFFIPHGPLIIGDFKSIFKELTILLKNIALSDKMDFIRFNSAVENTLEFFNIFKENGYINASMHEHAEDTHLLNLTPSLDKLLNNIKKKDRYYINRAIKEGVKIEIGNSDIQIENLINMHHNHSTRNNGKRKYSSFSDEYFHNLYKAFGNNNITTISASHNGIIESILMTIRFGKTCVYYIAASNIINHKFSPNYLCQWEAIKKAKSDGCNIYNFWGVSPDDNPKHPIAGVTKFKRKFAGYDYSLLHAQDLPLNKKYRINYMIESIRRLKRGYYYKKVMNYDLND